MVVGDDFRRDGEGHRRFRRAVSGYTNRHGFSGQAGQSGIAGQRIDFYGSFSGGALRAAQRSADCTGSGSGVWHDEDTAAAFLAKRDVFAGCRVGGEDGHAVFAGLFCGIHSLLRGEYAGRFSFFLNF